MSLSDYVRISDLALDLFRLVFLGWLLGFMQGMRITKKGPTHD